MGHEQLVACGVGERDVPRVLATAKLDHPEYEAGEGEEADPGQDHGVVVPPHASVDEDSRVHAQQ